MVKAVNTILCQVDDMDRAVAFYRDQLDLKPGMTTQWWSTFPVGSTQIGLHPPFEGGPTQPGRGWILGLEVEDLKDLRAKLESAGTSCAAYHDIPGGCVMDFADPDGNAIQAMQKGVSTKDLA